MKKWYLQTWFIALMFALWPLIIPAIIGYILFAKRKKEMSPIYDKIYAIESTDEYDRDTRQKADAYSDDTRRDADKYSSELRGKADKYAADTLSEADEKVRSEEIKRDSIANDIVSLSKEKNKLRKELRDLRSEIFTKYVEVYTDEKVTSEEYKNKLSLLKVEETEFVKSGKAVTLLFTRGRKEADENMKQILRCFNAESDNIVNSVTYKNIDSMRGKMQKTFEILNKLFSVDGLELVPRMLEIKLERLTLMYQYHLRKEQEREEQKEIRAQMLEEEKVRREIEREKAKIEKEESQFKNEVSKLMAYMQKASDIEKQLYVDKIRELEDKLKALDVDKENVLQREQNTRAGFVYVISNIGSFGENIYKIGMTRRLEPMDRIKELSDASVPFEFDVHAMIFSADAPALETTLHTTFRGKEVNKVNLRKEFFDVSLDEIEEVVKENHNATVTFTKVAEAAQYRESLRLAST